MQYSSNYLYYLQYGTNVSDGRGRNNGGGNEPSQSYPNDR